MSAPPSGARPPGAPSSVERDLPARAGAIVVGTGPAGCAVSRRLAEAGRDVLLLEAGEHRAPTAAGVMDLGPNSLVVDRHPAVVGGRPTDLPRGRTLGGSGAVNGGYCLPARPADLATWPAGWPRRYREGLARAVERLRPRIVPPDPVAALVDRAWPGTGVRVPQARRGGRRVNPVDAWDPVGVGARLATGAEVTTLVWAGTPGGRATGVRLADGTVVAADEVWLCAGALGSARILLASGIGAATGHPVGERTEEHPEVLLDLPPAWPAPERGALPPLLSSVARLAVRGEPVEVRPYSVPIHMAVPGADPLPHRIGVALMAPRSRGTVRLDSAGRVVVDLDAHPDAHDRETLDLAADRVGDRLGLLGEPVPSTSQHLSGTARISEVVDDHGLLLGCPNVRVADGSILPTLPRCGPSLSVAAVAEAIVARAVRS